MLIKLKNFFAAHWLAILCGLILAILIYYPLISFPFVAGDGYRGVNPPPFGWDAAYYLSRGKEILEGHGLGAVFLKEGKNGQNVYFSYNEEIILAPFTVFGMGSRVEITTIYTIYNFTGILVLVLLIYFLVLQMSGDKRLALATALLVIGGYSIIYHKTLFYDDFNMYGRHIFPYVSSLAFFGYLNLLMRSLKSAKRLDSILAAAVFGALFYIYFYAWTFAAALNASLTVLYLITKDYYHAQKLIFISIFGAALGIPNLLRLFLFMNSPAGQQLSYNHWLLSGRSLVFTNLGFATAVLFFIFWYFKRKDGNKLFISALILAGWISLNQQIITGKILQYNHYYWYFIEPLSIIVGLYMLWLLVNSEAIKKILFVMLLFVALINTAVGQYKSAATEFYEKIYLQNHQPIIQYLKAIKEPSVIMAQYDYAETLLTVYTNHDLLWAGGLELVPFQRVKDALFLILYFNKESRYDFVGYLTKTMAESADNPYAASYQNIEGYLSGFEYYDYRKRIIAGDPAVLQKRKEIFDTLMAEYESFIQNSNNVLSLLKRYDVKYVIWDKNRQPEWDLSFLRLKLLVSHNNIDLYEVMY